MNVRPTIPGVRAGKTAIVVVATAALAAGCGGSSPQNDVKSAFNKFVHQRATGDPAACDLLSQKFIKQQTGKSYAAGLAECRQRSPQNKLSMPSSLKIDKVTVNGSSATLTASVAGQGSASFGLIKEGGSWKVDSAPGA